MDFNSMKLYTINKEREESIWANCIFIFDSSALLDFYFFPKKTRQEIYQTILQPNKARLWIPAHVQYEYLKNRENIIYKPISEKYEPLKALLVNDIAKAIKQVEAKTTELHNHIKKNDLHPHFDDAEIKVFKSQIEQFELDSKELTKAILNHIDLVKKEIEDLPNNDDVLNAFEENLSVGREFSHKEIYEITVEGKHRYEFLIPPGYEDLKEKKGTQVFGDLIIWKQILEYSKEVNKDIIFICNDLKEDWCHLEKNSTEKRISSPREELIKEIYDFSGVEFWMYNLSQFLYFSNKYLGTSIEDKDIKSIANVITEKRKPILEVDLIWNGSSRSPNGYSDKNPIEKDENGSYVRIIGGSNVKPIIFWKLSWRFSVRIYNNSSYPAYNIQIESIGAAHFSQLEDLRSINNIKPFEHLDLTATFNESIEDVHTVADKILSFKNPERLEGLILKISYLDEDRNNHYTLMKIENNSVTNSLS